MMLKNQSRQYVVAGTYDEAQHILTCGPQHSQYANRVFETWSPASECVRQLNKQYRANGEPSRVGVFLHRIERTIQRVVT